MYIDATPQNARFAHGKIILLQASAAQIQHFPFTYGIESSSKQPSPSTFSDRPDATPLCRPTKCSMERSITIARPMAPPGTKIVVHEKPKQRRTWDPHGVDGWYLGPATKHYRYYRVFINKTRLERITDTVEFFPQEIEMPYPTPTEIAVEATKTLIRTLQNPVPSTPFAHQPFDRTTAIRTITDIFQPYATPGSTPTIIESEPIPPGTLPRVETRAKPTNPQKASPPIPRRTSPRVTPIEEDNPRYPRRHIIPIKHSANLITTMLSNNHKINVDLTFKPRITTDTNHWACAIIDPDTGATMAYRHLIKSDKHREAWAHSFANELGRLAQGIANREKGTNTIFFIPHSQIPQKRRKDVTYGRICVDHRPQKKEVNRTRLTVGGNLINFLGDVSTPTADPTTAKLVINQTLSTPHAKYMCGAIEYFYLGTPMSRYEYMRLPISIIPQEIIDAYNLMPLVHNGHVYIEINEACTA
jgi:hypothetical protein